MESLVRRNFNGIFSGKRVLLTGHTGFKGSWMTQWLTLMGAEVYGLSLAPETTPAHWDLLQIPEEKGQFQIGDVGQYEKVHHRVQAVKPELVIHLAAQPLVRQSYLEPVYNWQTNVMGTVHLLEACRNQSSVKAIVVATTDKVYENPESGVAFNEQSPLGGHDPYSASKAACELVVQSYSSSFFNSAEAPLISTARAGNVIGGGDWAADRLIPDVVRASQSGLPLKLRYPSAVRPWQHVLDSLSGYLMLAAALLKGDRTFNGSWNFGPPESDCLTVCGILQLMQHHWPQLQWLINESPQWHEAGLLRLNTQKAQAYLGWLPVWDVEEAAANTALWYKAFYQRDEVLTVSQLADYVRCAQKKGLIWAIN